MRSASIRHITSLLLVWGSVGVLAGCSTEEPHGSTPRNTSESTRAVSRGSLLAEFERTIAQDQRSFQLHAQFLDAQGVPVDTAMQALEVWSFDSSLDQDTCSLQRRTSAARRERTEQVDLQLLDMGAITVNGPEHTLRLEGRRLPDLSSSFSGVIYGLDEARPSPRSRPVYRPGELYTFEAPGRRSTGSFRVELRAPTPIELRLPAGQRRDDGSIAWERGDDLELRWSSGRGSATDTVFFDVSTGVGPDALHLKCRLEDDGTFHLPFDVLEQLTRETSSLRIALRRVHTESVAIDGLDLSRFTLATVDRRRLVLIP